MMPIGGVVSLPIQSSSVCDAYAATTATATRQAGTTCRSIEAQRDPCDEPRQQGGAKAMCRAAVRSNQQVQIGSTATRPKTSAARSSSRGASRLAGRRDGRTSQAAAAPARACPMGDGIGGYFITPREPRTTRAGGLAIPARPTGTRRKSRSSVSTLTVNNLWRHDCTFIALDFLPGTNLECTRSTCMGDRV